MKEIRRGPEPISERPATLPRPPERPVSVGVAPLATEVQRKDTFVPKEAGVRPPTLPQLPTLPESSVFHGISTAIAKPELTSNELARLKSQLGAVHQSRGWLARVSDFFGSKEGKTHKLLRSYLDQRFTQERQTELQRSADTENRRDALARDLNAKLMTDFSGSTRSVVDELLKRATLASADRDASAFGVSLRALSQLSKSPDETTSQSAISALAQVQKLPVLERGSGPRTPTEVLVNLAADLKSLDSATPTPTQRAVLTEAQQQIKSAFLSHQMNVEQTRQILSGITNRLHTAGLYELAGKTSEYLQQLPSKPTDIPSTRYHDNIYGRVYDSSLVAHLVKDPPAGVKDAMTKSGQMLADWMSDPSRIPPDDLNAAAEKAQKYLKDVDPRFWFKKAPGIERVRDAKTPDEARIALLDFLRSPKQTGEETIAIPYLTVKLSIILRDLATSRAKKDAESQGMQVGTRDYNQYVKQHTYEYTPWMSKADENYNIVGVQASRDGGMKPATKMAAAGITLQHQPAAVAEDWMTPSTRPATLNRPRLGDQVSEATQLALSQGIPFASGVSGSTNINLHFLDYMTKHSAMGQQINPKDYFLGNTMFLVHDGGHSIHEALWVANQTQPKMGLGLALGDPSRPNTFVSNIHDLIKSNEGESSQKLQNAANLAWTDTTNYFNKHSAFASPSGR